MEWDYGLRKRDRLIKRSEGAIKRKEREQESQRSKERERERERESAKKVIQKNSVEKKLEK